MNIDISEISPLVIALIAPIITGLVSYFASTSKSKKDILQLKEQNKLDIEKLIKEHDLDLEAQGQKHKMEKEKIEIEHAHRIELMQKEMENKIGTEFMSQLASQIMNNPEIKNQITRSALQGGKKKR